VWANLMMTAAAAWDIVLVHGGAGGIGTMAIQVASRYGARVIATSSTDLKRQRCQELGAEVVIDYRNEDFVTGSRADRRPRRGRDPRQHGAAYLPGTSTRSRPAVHLVVIGMQGGQQGELHLGTLMAKRAVGQLVVAAVPPGAGEGGDRRRRSGRRCGRRSRSARSSRSSDRTLPIQRPPRRTEW